jgi:hypothetical protein
MYKIYYNNKFIILNAASLKMFKLLFTNINAAGGVVRNRKGEYLIIFRKEHWDLPKGKADKGESPGETALREVEEECGIDKLKITRRLPSTYHLYILNGKIVLKKTHWFEMNTSSRKKLKPQIDEGIIEAIWVNKLKLNKLRNKFYPSLAEILNAIIPVKTTPRKKG